MVHIAGSSTRAIVDLQRGDYEELDQLAVARPVAKASYRIDRIEDIEGESPAPSGTAVSGRPGGVYPDIPGTCWHRPSTRRWAPPPCGRSPTRHPADSPPDAVERAVDLLSSAERPLIVLGKGAAYAQADEAIGSFVTASGIPLFQCQWRRDYCPTIIRSAPRRRVHSRYPAPMSFCFIGARLNWLLHHGDSPHWSPSAKFVQIDIEPTGIRQQPADCRAPPAISVPRSKP